MPFPLGAKSGFTWKFYEAIGLVRCAKATTGSCAGKRESLQAENAAASIARIRTLTVFWESRSHLPSHLDPTMGCGLVEFLVSPHL